MLRRDFSKRTPTGFLMVSNEFNLEKIFLILRIRLWWIVGFFIGAVLLAALVTVQMPKMYMATTSLNFDFSGNNPLDSRGRSILAEDSYLTTQVGILQSLNVGQKVVESLSDYERARVIDALGEKRSKLDLMISRIKKFAKTLFSGPKKAVLADTPQNEVSATSSGETLEVASPYDWLAGSLGSDLVINPLVDSRIVEVSYYSTDPQVAALLSNRFAEAYIATNLRMVIDPARKTKIWFDEQLTLLRAQLEEAQAKLTAYQQREGIVSSDERIDIESTHLRGLADQLASAQQARRIEETKLNKLNEVLGKGDSLMTFEPVFSNSVVQRINTDIRDIEAKLAEGANSLGANHPKMKTFKSELAAAKQRLNREIQSIVDGVHNAVELSRERQKTLEDALEQQKALVLRLKNEHDKIVVLQRDVESAQAAYNAALNQLNTTNMQSMVDQTNVSIVDHARVPTYHATPRLTKNVAVGGFGGLVLGFGFAMFMEIFRRRVHTEDDIVGELGIPLLGQLNRY